MMIKTEFFKNQFPSGITEEQRYTHMNKNKTLASQLINQIVEKDFVGAKDSFASLIRQKSLTRLGEKKIEVASRMFVSEAKDSLGRRMVSAQALKVGDRVILGHNDDPHEVLKKPEFDIEARTYKIEVMNLATDKKYTAEIYSRDKVTLDEARDTSPETLAKIKAADKSYSKMSTQELKKLYQQHYRVSNVSGMSKNNLIGDILRAEFGNKAVDMAVESVEETELDEANKLSDLSSMQQFQLLNDYLGLKMHGAIRQFRDNPDFVKKAIADHKIDSKTLEAALEKMKKDGNLDRNFKLNEDADLLDEAYVDRFAKKRKENGSELKDWTMKKLDMFRDMPHGSYTNKEIQQEYQRRIKTGEYVKA